MGTEQLRFIYGKIESVTGRIQFEVDGLLMCKLKKVEYDKYGVMIMEILSCGCVG